MKAVAGGTWSRRASLCGLAMGTKYNGLLTFFLLSCFVPLAGMRRADSPPGMARLRREGASAPSAPGCLFAAVALAVFSPWMIRNTLWTGNPVYPLYDGLFRPAAAGAPPLQAERGRRRRRRGRGEG